MKVLECNQFELLWSLLEARKHPDGFKELRICEIMPEVVGVSVMSALTNDINNSLNELNLSKNASWWKDNTLLFNQLITLLTQQT